MITDPTANPREQYLGNVVPMPVREMPHDAAAERAVIGSMMMGGRAVIEEMHSVLPTQAFYVPAHATIYSAILSAHSGGVPCDPITLSNELAAMDMLDMVGGRLAITEMFTMVSGGALAAYYADIVREKFLLRRMIEGGMEAVRQAFEPGGELQEKIDSAQKFFTDLALSLSKRGALMRPTSETIPEALAEIEAIYHNRGSTRGMATGFHGLDRMTGGLKPGQVVTLAARPAMGKSSLAMNIAENVAVDEKTAVAVFSLEMSTAELTQRMLLSRSRVAVQHLRDGFMKEADFPRMTAASKALIAAKIFIDDTPGLRLFEFMARARKARVTLGVGLIIIDYVQLMSSGTKRGMENRVLEITEITGGIKKIARELEVPVIMLAQLNRNAENRPQGKPRLADLRESGSIEQDSDIVAFIHRAEMYAQDDEQKLELEGQATLIVAKHRNGPVGDLPLTFMKEYTRFENRAGENFVSNNTTHRQENRRENFFPKKSSRAVEDDV